MTIERIKHDDVELAIIIRRSYKTDDINFLTPPSYSQQLGVMRRPAGYDIEPHIHTKQPREVIFTNEVLFIKSGKMRVDFYTETMQFLTDRILETGDVILLIQGGHGFHMLEETEIIEVKQGPYAGDADKKKFAKP